MIRKTLEIELTPEELAEAFCNMHSDDQARFFNGIGMRSKGWPNGGFCPQALAIIQDPALTSYGRYALEKLASHLEPAA